MGVRYGALYSCESCGREEFIKQVDAATGWILRDKKMLCPTCSVTSENHNKILDFLKAQSEAEERGLTEFVCPSCGGVAFWQRSALNNHLYSECKSCGFKIIE